MEIVEITAASFQEESKVLSIPVETVIIDEQDGYLTEAFDEDVYAQCLKSVMPCCLRVFMCYKQFIFYDFFLPI